MQLSEGADTLSSSGEGSCMGGGGGGGYWFGPLDTHATLHRGALFGQRHCSYYLFTCPAVYRLGVEIIKKGY